MSELKKVTLTLEELAKLVVLSEQSAKMNAHLDAMWNDKSCGYLANILQKRIFDVDKEIEKIYNDHGVNLEELFELQNTIYNELNN